MKTLIINGSPRVDGDTAFLVRELKKQLDGDIVEISAYRNKISPCLDCRKCWESPKCVIQDDMQIIYSDNFDNVVIASPIHMQTLPGPMLNLAGRFQLDYAAKIILKQEIVRKPKKAALILTGGGDGSPEDAIKTAKWIFRFMNADNFWADMILSLKTDVLPTKDDACAIHRISEVAVRLNGVYV